MDNRQKQFVISEHTTTDDVHWDLMLEMDDSLWTWRLNTPPAEIKNEPVPAERIHDHSLRFLTYEGPVQNNTGRVKITDKGTYTQHVIPSEATGRVEGPIETVSSSLKQNQPDRLTLEMNGNILKGKFTLSDFLTQTDR